MKLGFLLSLILAFCLFVYTASAQIPVSTGGLELTPSTNNPVPGQTVSITARSYAIDISSATVTWTVNGTQVHKATGATTFAVQAPSLGKKTSIEVVATTPEGRSVGAVLVLHSGSVDLIFESDGYSHPFFKGKILPVHQNTVTIIAVPHIANVAGVEYDPKNLSYEWKKNDSVLESQSGFGKQSINIVGDIVPRPYTISVTVWPKDTSASAEAIADVSPKNPFISFYVDDPQYGTLFNQAIGSVFSIGKQKEVAVLAVPFGFNLPKNGFGELSWSWLINNQRRNELSTNKSIVLRAPEDSAGRSKVQLSIRNLEQILQSADSSFSVLFGNRSDEVNQVEF